MTAGETNRARARLAAILAEAASFAARAACYSEDGMMVRALEDEMKKRIGLAATALGLTLVKEEGL
jgi:hypothetical protein